MPQITSMNLILLQIWKELDLDKLRGASAGDASQSSTAAKYQLSPEDSRPGSEEKL